MESIQIFFRSFAIALLVFAGEVIILRIWAKKLRNIRKSTLPPSEKRSEGAIGILVALAAMLAVSPLAYSITRRAESAEALVIISGLLIVAFCILTGNIFWHSAALIIARKEIRPGGIIQMEKHNTCPMPDSNPATEDIKELLKSVRTIAVVGLSDNPEKDSYRVARYLIEKGYNVIPVNPGKKEILGRTCYPDLSSIPEKIDIVDIFRPVEAIPPIVDEAINVGAKVIWMQKGLAHPESAEKARNAGLKVIQSTCIKMEHSKIFGGDAGITFNLQ